MNKNLLAADFKKRYGVTEQRLIFTRIGTLCELMGNTAAERSLTCALSMGVTAAACRTDTGYIKIESTVSNICRRFRVDDLSRFPFDRRFNGADLLYHSDLPDNWDSERPIRAALTRLLLRLARADNMDARIAAALCERGKNIGAYTAMLGARRGFCTLINGGGIRSIPLPTTGYLFVCISWNKRRRQMPLTLTDSEKARMHEACAALKAYSLERFAALVNESSLASVPQLSRAQQMLLRVLPETDGCLCAHASGADVWALAEADKTDYVIRFVRDRFEESFGSRPHFAVCGKL